jgi:DNA-binding CsgD family transcriptional regulator
MDRGDARSREGERNTAAACDGPTALGSFRVNGHRFVVYPPGDRTPDDGGSAAGMVLVDGRPCPIVELVQGSADGLRDPALMLTPRELQIAALVAHGQCSKRIAYRLHISEWTVQTHLRRIYAKLGVAGRAEMVFRCAPRLGMAT